MSENWKDSRAEAAMREEGRKIMKAAKEKKAKEELVAGKTLSQFDVSIVSHGKFNEEDLLVLIALVDQLKEKSEHYDGLEVKVKHVW